MNLTPPVPIHRLFIEYIILNEISNFPEGISGYRLKKTMNDLLIREMNQKNNIPQFNISQSFVYREFKDLKKKGLLDKTNIVENNRNKNLYKINENGKKRLQHLSKIMVNLAPIQADPIHFAEDFLSGKISPLNMLEKLSKNIPKEQLLNQLKLFRQHLTKALQDITAKIDELEKDL